MEKPAHSVLYKSKPKRVSQDDRRIRLLKEQKHQREKIQDEQRDIVTPTKWCHPQRRPRRFHEIFGRHLQLQVSEWLREKPDNLNDWILMPCPRGQRCFLVAYRQHTVMYSSRGRSCFTFQSLLPGNTGNNKNLTILDSIYDAGTDTFFILDVLAFGTQRFRYCETEMRFFWLKSKFDEEPFAEVSSLNDKKLCLLPRYDMDDMETVRQVFLQHQQWPQNEPDLDGYLFYHKEASYTCGTTPLVGWLFPFMVQDILGEAVHGDIQKPDNYEISNPQAYMDEFEAEQKAKRQRGGERTFYENTQTAHLSEHEMRRMGYIDNQSQQQYLTYLKRLRADNVEPNKALEKIIERQFPYVFEYDDDDAALWEEGLLKRDEDNAMDENDGEEFDGNLSKNDDWLNEGPEEMMPH